MKQKRINIKVTLVGDSNVGKTSFIHTFQTGQFPEGYVPTIYESYLPQITINSQIINIPLWDTNGSNEYDSLRPLSYPQTDIFLLCFSLTDKTSFDNITSKWLPEILFHNETSQYILVGFKHDEKQSILQSNPSSHQIVDSNDIKQLAEEIEASGYIEVSSKSNYNVREVIELCVSIVTSSSSHSSKFFCVIN